MSDMKFYCTKDKEGNFRHVLVATGDVVDGKVAVERVGFHPSVEGTAKRGRMPNLLEPVEVSTLVEMASEDVPEGLIQKAEQLLAPPAQTDETETEVN